MDAAKESLQTLKVFLTFPRYESFPMLFSRVAPALRNLRFAAGEILDAQQPETSLSKKQFVLARRYEKIEANRTTDSELFMRHHSCNNHRIGEQNSSLATQDAMPLTKDGEPLIDMTHRIV